MNAVPTLMVVFGVVLLSSGFLLSVHSYTKWKRGDELQYSVAQKNTVWLFGAIFVVSGAGLTDLAFGGIVIVLAAFVAGWVFAIKRLLM